MLFTIGKCQLTSVKGQQQRIINMKKTEKQMIAEMQMMLEFLISDCLDENGDNQECPCLHDDLTAVHTLLSNMTGFNEIEM
jgi:hypothetical protein